MTRFDRSLAQQIQLILVETAFQPEKQAVVTLPRSIDRFLIDQYRVHDAAHFHQLLPFPAVSCKTRYLTGSNRPNLPKTYLGHHPLEAGSDHRTCSGTAQVIIDHFDLAPA